MEPSSPRWLSDLVKDDISISFPHQYEMMLHCLEDYTFNDLNFHPDQIQKSPSISPNSEILSFGGTTDGAAVTKEERKNLVPKGKQVCSSVGLSIRSPFYAKEHVVAERKRREKISQRFIALSALLPDLKKMDKASVLGEAAKYVKHLQEHISKLETEAATKSMVLVKKSQVVSAGDDSYSSDETSAIQTHDRPEIEARLSHKHVLIRVHCERRPSCTAKILDLIEKMNLSVLNNSVVSFGNSLLDITIVAQMEVEFDMTIDELVKNLRQELMGF